MGTIADLLVVVLYCLGVYTLLGVVAGLFEWWAVRSKRVRPGVTEYSAFSQGRVRGHRQNAPGKTLGLSGIFNL